MARREHRTNAVLAEERKQLLLAARSRHAIIAEMCLHAGRGHLAADFIRKDYSVEKVRQILPKSPRPQSNATVVRVIEDERVRVRNEGSQIAALCVKAGRPGLMADFIRQGRSVQQVQEFLSPADSPVPDKRSVQEGWDRAIAAARGLRKT
jgi:hypothetical protein